MEEEKKDVLGEIVPEETVEVSSDIPTENGLEDVSINGRKSKPLNKKFIAILILIIILAVGYSGYKSGKFDSMLGKKTQVAVGMTPKEAEDFINTNLMQDGSTKAAVQTVTEENDLYKIKLTVGGQDYTIYLTKDKSTFFPQAISIADIQKQKADAAAQAQADATKQTEMVKTDKPTVQLFVMSHCPYGTQMEKGIIPAIEALGSKVDFKIEFCDYSMHGDKELKEELNQYCISQNQSDKYLSYLKCFLGDENSSDKCMGQVGINKSAISSCVASTDSKYKITANAADKSTWKSGSYPAFPIFQADVDKYKVSGSPTLVINGTTATSGRDSASLLKTICSAFTTAPAECSKTLDSTAPAAGFGYAASSTGAAPASASCGS
jgi:hypothetical protein